MKFKIGDIVTDGSSKLEVVGINSATNEVDVKVIKGDFLQKVYYRVSTSYFRLCESRPKGHHLTTIFKD